MRSSTIESETGSAAVEWWSVTGLLRTGPAEYRVLGYSGSSFGPVDIRAIDEDAWLL